VADDRAGAALQAAAEATGLKTTHIVLSAGEHASQPMLTRHTEGSFAEVMAETRELCRRLEERGLTVSRSKLEIDADNPFAPADRVQALARPAQLYFECHVKVLVRGAEDLQRTRQLGEERGAHLSRNALRTRDDGAEERFLTQRFYGAGHDEAAAGQEALLTSLQSHGLTVIETEAEYVVFDSHVELDAGWLPAAPIAP
jgi:hypothetical protein